MARSATKKKSADNGKPSFAKISNKSDMKRSKNYIRLNDDEKFNGYALFDADPEVDDNEAWVQYEEHWDQQMQRFVPCWGAKDGCFYCKAGQNASTRAMVAFLVTEENGEKLKEPMVKTMRLNWSVLSEFLDSQDEDGSTRGKLVRIKCESRSDGEYKVKIFDSKPLPKKEVKEALKEVPDLPAQIQRNLDQALDALRVQDVLDEDDDDDDDVDEVEETPAPKKRGRPKKEEVVDEEDDDEDEEPDDDEEDEVDEDEEDDEDEDEESEDDDEDSEDEDEDEDEEDEETTLDGEFTIKSVNESSSNLTLKEVENDLYFDSSIISEVDWEDLKKGDTVRVVATLDEEDDYVATEFSKVEAKKGRKKTSKS